MRQQETGMPLDGYFRRIGYAGPAVPTVEALNAVHAAQITSIPFENLDVQLGRRTAREPAAVYDKLVVRRRGGWCYEQNGLLGWALAGMGFDVTRVAAAVMRHERGPVATANHLCLLVRLPGRAGPVYLADAGFGGSLVAPIELRPQRIRQAPFELRLERLDDGHWRFTENDGSGDFSYDFEAVAGDEQALGGRRRFLERDPSSGFVQTLVVQRRFPDARLTLRGRVLTAVGPQGRRERTLTSAADLAATLEDELGLCAPEAAALWPKICHAHDEYLRRAGRG